MTTKSNKKKVQKEERPDLNRAQRRAMAKRIREASTFSIEELIQQITEHPNSMVSVSCCVDFKWEDFMKKYGYATPERPEGMSDEEWEKEKQGFENFIASEKQVAKFWYVMGLSHHSEIHSQLLEALNAPEEKTQEGE